MDLLLQLEEGKADGALVCGMAEAYAKALEHQLLLNMLVPDSRADSASSATRGGGQGAVSFGKSFRISTTPGYEVRSRSNVLDYLHMSSWMCQEGAYNPKHHTSLYLTTAANIPELCSIHEVGPSDYEQVILWSLGCCLTGCSIVPL